MRQTMQKSCVLLLSVGLWPWTAAHGDIIRVDKDAPGITEDGASWGTAFFSLSDAIQVADGSDEIWVAGEEKVSRSIMPLR